METIKEVPHNQRNISTGSCCNCTSPAYHPLENICEDCASQLGLRCNTFTNYTYPSELMYMSHDLAHKRTFFVKGIMYF